jgi:hypothetical protein
VTADVAELRGTVERMETRLRREAADEAQALLSVYDELVPRFADDLADERDQLLSRGGALMLIQEVVRS